MNPNKARLVLGGAAALLSLGGTAWSAGMQVHYSALLAGAGSPVAPINPAFLPAGVKAPPSRARLTNAQLKALRIELWRNPLDQKLGNLVYLDKALSDSSRSAINQQAKLLAATGWRYSPAQYNLLVHAAENGDFHGALDRIEALLRRQSFTAPAIMMMNVMEVYPATRPLILAKLLSRPEWRNAYLTTIGADASKPLIDARVDMVTELLQRGEPITRSEIGGFLNMLVARGRSEDAYNLWRIYARRQESQNLVYDGDFKAAAALSTAAVEPFPFEWSFGQDIGFSTQLGEGAIVTWNGRGAPVFFSQRVPVQAGRSYSLRIGSRSGDGNAPAKMLTPVIECGNRATQFIPVRDEVNVATFRSESLPLSCTMGVLTIGGNVDSGSNSRTLSISSIQLSATQ